MRNNDIPILVTPQNKVIFDWYDGIVGAFIKFNEYHVWCFIRLEVFDPTRESKIYSLQILDESDEIDFLEEIKPYSPLQATWFLDNSLKLPKVNLLVDKLMDITKPVSLFFNSDGFNQNEILIKNIASIPKREKNIDDIYSMPRHEIDSWFNKIDDASNG